MTVESTSKFKAQISGQEIANYLTGKDTSADVTGREIDCRGYGRVTFEFTIKATNDPVGALYIRGSGASGAAKKPIPIDEGKVLTDAAEITHTSADLTKIVVADPAAAASVMVIISSPPPFMDAFWDWTSGGGTSDDILVNITLDEPHGSR